MWSEVFSESSKPAAPQGEVVVPLNDGAALYLALADRILGAAVGMSPHGQALLRQGLIDRFGNVLGVAGDDAVAELLKLATTARAS